MTSSSTESRPRIWHYLIAGYIGAFVWTILANLGGLVTSTSTVPIQQQIIVSLIATPFASILGLLIGVAFKLASPFLIMFPRKIAAIIFWMFIGALIAIFTRQVNITDYRFYISFAMAAVSGLCFELILSAFQKKNQKDKNANKAPERTA